MNILISSYDVFENNKFIKLLQGKLKHEIVIADIASDFDIHAKNDIYAGQLQSLFEDKTNFEVTIKLVDSRLSIKEAKAIVDRADVLFLSGGDTYLQYQNLVRYELIKHIKEHSKLVIGMSAGALNMAETVCLPNHLDKYVDNLMMYDGIGRVDFSILPHYDDYEADFIESLPEEVLYGIDNNGFIYCDKNDIILDKCHII